MPSSQPVALGLGLLAGTLATQVDLQSYTYFCTVKALGLAPAAMLEADSRLRGCI